MTYKCVFSDIDETLLNSKKLFQNCVYIIFGAIACVIVMPMAALLIGKQSRKA